jgi:hypothetical protein
MTKEDFKNQLLEIYTTFHGYCNNLLSDKVEPDVYNWTPPETKGRSILSYFRHIVNTEIYWLYALQKHNIQFATKDTSIDEMLQIYRNMEEVYSKMIKEASEKDLEIKETKITTKKETNAIIVNQSGTLAWTVLRISLHAFGHLSQVTYILYSLGVRGKEDEKYNWWNMTESIINLGKLIKL